jgi:hypothetical protein
MTTGYKLVDADLKSFMPGASPIKTYTIGNTITSSAGPGLSLFTDLSLATRFTSLSRRLGRRVRLLEVSYSSGNVLHDTSAGPGTVRVSSCDVVSEIT